MKTLNIYDFDGTLFDTSSALFLAYKEAYKVFDKKLTRSLWDEYFGHHVSRLNTAIGISDIQADGLKSMKYRLYPDRYIDIIQPIAEMVNSIDENNFNVICSQTDKSVVSKILNHFELSYLFNLVLDTSSVDGLRKPDPAIFLKAINHFKNRIDKVNIYEDSEVGLEAAKATKEISKIPVSVFHVSLKTNIIEVV